MTRDGDTDGIDAFVISTGELVFDAFEIGPKEGEPILFLHGFPQFADAWKSVMRRIAKHGFRALAFDQRGYSRGARPQGVASYATHELVMDVLRVSDVLGMQRFHLVAHDWGGMLAWQFAEQFPDRLMSLTVLSVPHTTAILDAIEHDEVQAQMSEYISFFRSPGNQAEIAMLADGAKRLRAAYRGKVASDAVERNVNRLAETGALTAVLNWYRALDMDARGGRIQVPTLFMWGDQDHALGEAAALATSNHVDAPYRFERLHGLSHWLLDEAQELIADSLLAHFERAGVIGEHDERT